MTEYKPIKIGLIGAGGIANRHVQGYADHKDSITFAAVADPIRENAERRSEGTSAVIYDSYQTMLLEADIDAVDICLPHHLHRDAIIAAARAGKHILCEKPLCLTLEESRDVSAAIAESGVTLMCAHNNLFLPAVSRAKSLIDDGALGQIYEVRTVDIYYNDFDPTTMGWRAHASTSGGGELIDTGYHPTYLLLHLAGGVATEVTAVLATHRLKFMEGEDSANLIVRFDNGVVGTLMTSWAYRAAPGTERFAVVGELGSLWSDGVELRVQIGGGDVEVIELEEVDDYSEEIRHFAHALQHGERPIATEIEGRQSLELILAAYESAENGAVAQINHSAA
jgi:predicted dehydrogenase